MSTCRQRFSVDVGSMNEQKKEVRGAYLERDRFCGGTCHELAGQRGRFCGERDRTSFYYYFFFAYYSVALQSVLIICGFDIFARGTGSA